MGALPLELYFRRPDAVACTPILFPRRICPLVRLAPTFILAPKLCNAVASQLIDIKEISLNLTRNFSIPDTNCGSSESKFFSTIQECY